MAIDPLEIWRTLQRARRKIQPVKKEPGGKGFKPPGPDTGHMPKCATGFQKLVSAWPAAKQMPADDAMITMGDEIAHRSYG